METLKDYAHLYVECEVETVGGNGINLGHYYPEVWLRTMDKVEPNGINVFFPNANKIYVMNYIQCKLKLRLLSSLTDQKKEFIYDFIFPANIAMVTNEQKIAFIDFFLNDPNNTTDEFILYENIARYMTFYDNCKLINHLLKMHFDLFGLIEKGLAIDLNK